MSRGRIEGLVLDRRGRPVAGCTVMLTGASPDHPDIAALTGDDGAFSFLDLEPGSYEVLARAEDGASEVGGVTVRATGTSRLELRLAV